MRGYFGIGVEGVSKAMNVGSLFRTAHAFGASFVFTVDPRYERQSVRSADTSDAKGHVPFYEFPTADALVLPAGCDLVGIELTDDAVDLPSFRHPKQAAYILGPEQGSLSPAMQSRCSHIIKIPTKFCINVGLAGAITMYDRTISTSKFAPRHVSAGAPVEGLPEHKHGGRFTRKTKNFILSDLEQYESPPPLGEVDVYKDD